MESAQQSQEQQPQQQQQQQEQQKICHLCKEEKQKLLTCTGCNKAQYCSKQCQKDDWKSHKQQCNYKKSQQKTTVQQNKQEGQNQNSQSLHNFVQNFDQMKIDPAAEYRKKQAEALKKQFKEEFAEIVKKDPINLAYFDKTKEQKEDKQFGDVLSLDSLSKVQLMYGKICGNQLKEVEQNYRNKRREALDKNAQEYAQCIFGSFQDKDELLRISQEVVLEHLNLKLKSIEDSIKFYSKYGYREKLAQAMRDASESQRSVNNAKNPVTSAETIKNIFEYQKTLVIDDKKTLLQYLQSINMPPRAIQDIISQVISSYLLDKTSIKFKVEEEDVNAYLKEDKNWTPELTEIEKQINEGTYAVINAFVTEKMKNLRVA